MINQKKAIEQLQEVGVDLGASVTFRPLTGGVSSDIWLIESAAGKYVVKQALPTLKVKDHWAADVKRNLAEQAYIHFVSTFNPGAVPKILLSDDSIPYFIMEFLGPPLQNWKEKLLQGEANALDAVQAAKLLAQIHNQSMQDQSLSARFDHLDGFYALRLEPYLVTAGKRNPKLAKYFTDEVDRLLKSRSALVHGDYSPKNMMVGGDRLVLLDHEVACWADPSFDIAFLTNHLLLKLLHHHPGPIADIQIDMSKVAWNTYFTSIHVLDVPRLEKSSIHLLLMLMLARVDGKSPVEYLSTEKRQWVREFVYKYLPMANLDQFDYLCSQFVMELQTLSAS